jgi:transposase
MKKQRKHYAPEEKVAILRRHLLEEEPISKLCDEVGLPPTVFYRSQKGSSRTELLHSSRKDGRTIPPSRSGSYLERKIQTKDEVLAELMAEHVGLKKTLAEL